MPAVAAQVVDQVAGIAAGLVGGGVDVDVGVLGGQRDHLRGPRVADMTAHDDQLGELQRDGVQVGDRPARLGGAQRPGVPDLQAERDAQLDAFGVQRVVAAVAGRQVPQPRHHPQRPEAKITHAAPQLPHRVHGAGQVDGGDPGEPARVPADGRGYGIVGNQRPARPPPGAQHPDLHARRVHRRRRLEGNLVPAELPGGPASQRIEHRVGQQFCRRMLHPGIDDHHASPPVAVRIRNTPRESRPGPAPEDTVCPKHTAAPNPQSRALCPT